MEKITLTADGKIVTERRIGGGLERFEKPCACTPLASDWIRNYLGHIAAPPHCKACGRFWIRVGDLVAA
jgi:hypothetical protein